MKNVDVLIVGAGPTGLVLALWLTKQGISIRIIDKDTGPGTTSRAMAVQARTLELYRQLDLAEEVIAGGHKNPAMNLWARGEHKARVSFASEGEKLTPYPYILIFPQDLHEQVLVRRLEAMGIQVERQTELLSFQDCGDHVTARLRDEDGTEESCDILYLAGCDGARSTVRHAIDVGFPGGTYDQTFYVADVRASGVIPADEAHIALDDSDFVVIMSYGKNGLSRLIGTIRDEDPKRSDPLTFADVSHNAIEHLGLKIETVNWFSTYRVHHRVADHFRKGRVFLLGDAAHVHSPAGGQGMNTGIADAINLAWKLAAVLQQSASESLLDSYESERIAFAQTLVRTTDRLFTFATSDGDFADFVRTRIAPTVARVAYSIGDVREYLFRILSQTMLHYGESPLSEGEAGSIKGGDRMPWVHYGTVDNFSALKTISWQVHVYGAAGQDLESWCRTHNLPLHLYGWQPGYEKIGLAKDAMFLIRPDTYIALAASKHSTDVLEEYFAKHQLVLPQAD